MNTIRPRVLGSVLVFVVLLLALLWLVRSSKLTTTRSEAGGGNNGTGSTATNAFRANQQLQSTSLRSNSAGSLTAAAPQAELSNSIMQWSQQVHRPIEFYGTVLDESGLPVEGATVEFGWTYFHPEGYFKTNTLTDSNGLFSLRNVIGAGLSVQVSKQGYFTMKSRNEGSFNYSEHLGSNPYRPDSGNPVVFHLLRKGPGADLITSQRGMAPDIKIVAPRDGTPVRIDLFARSVAEAGQIEISQSKPEYVEWKQAKEWRFRMSIPDGGFVEHNDEFPFAAPENGYQSVVEFRFNKADTNWATRLQKQYYIAFGQPRRYGRLVVETEIQAAGARLQYAINPDGSRYLEPKEKQPQRRELPPGVVEIIPKQTE